MIDLKFRTIRDLTLWWEWMRCPFCGEPMFFHLTQTDVRCWPCNRQSCIRGGLLVHDRECEHHCKVEEPFGFVPEAGCPVHAGSCKRRKRANLAPWAGRWRPEVSFCSRTIWTS